MNESKLIRFLLVALGVFLAAKFFYAVRVVLAPFVLAAVFAFVMNPVVRFMELRGVRRSSAVMLLYAALTVGFVALAYWAAVVLWADLPKLRYQLPAYLQQFNAAAVQLGGLLSEKCPWLVDKKAVEHGASQLVLYAQNALQAAPHYVATIATIAIYFILVPFVSYYLLKEGKTFFQGLLNACPGRWMEKYLSLFYEIDAVLGNYLRGIFFEAILVGVLATVALFLLGIPYAALVGAVVCVGNIVPYLGPILGSAVGAAVAFFQFNNVVAPIKVLLAFAAIKFVDDWFFQPFIMRRSVDLHPVIVILSLLCGGELAGFWGLLLGVPVVCIVHEVAKVFSAWSLAESRTRKMPREVWEAAGRPWIV
ncbi:MAG TPA: AI-2E family transporter [Elusimicrobiota bacterium]|nr:AI-2E family transporter [Elusimicrobiota bacterium]